MQDTDTFELWPENVEPLNTFMRLQTQWRVGPSGPTGLDYAGLRAGLAMMGRRISPMLFEDLQAMESAALRVMQEKRDGA